jgi:type II secretory pathway component PulK
MIANELRVCRMNRRGVAMIPTLLAVAGMSIFVLALLMSVITTKTSVNHQAD